MKGSPWTCVLWAAVLLVIGGGAASAQELARYGMPAWVSFAVLDPGDYLEVSATARSGYPTMIGVHLFAPDGARLGGAFSQTAGQGIDIAVATSAIDLRLRPAPPNASGFTGVGQSIDEYHAKIYAVAWVAGRDLEWVLDVTSENPARVIQDFQLGRKTFYLDGTEFHGEATARVQTGPAELGVARTATRALTIENTFLGRFGYYLPDARTDSTSIEGPNGIRTCPCSIREVVGPGALPAAEYLLRWDGAEIDLGSPILAGADISLPFLR